MPSERQRYRGQRLWRRTSPTSPRRAPQEDRDQTAAAASHEFLAAARQQAATSEFDEVYRNKRPMVERSLAWPTRGTNRRPRFRGIARNQLGWANRRATINLQRLLNLGLTATDEGWAIA